MAPAPNLPDLSTLTGPHAAARREMVEMHLLARGLSDARIVRAMLSVPREAFVDATQRATAYADSPLPIGRGQTISQPYIVARMSELAEVTPGTRVLEIGFGSGYQTALLLTLGAEVWGLELEPELARQARQRLNVLGFDAARCHLRVGDGFAGWPEAAPFGVILLAAAPEALPEALLEQLAPGGRLVGPAGRLEEQVLYRLRRTPEGVRREEIMPVRFVPMRRRPGSEAGGGAL